MQNLNAKLQDFNWNDLRYILTLGRSDSLAMAARKLGVNESTVGRRISRVENLLDSKLFVRSAGGLSPTAVGASAIKVAEKIELQTQGLLADISSADQRVTGNVRLTSVPIVLNHLVIPALPSLISKYPGMGIEVVAESRNLSLTKRHADLAIRLSRPNKEPQVVTRKIGELDYAVYASTKSKSEVLPWINYEEEMNHLPQAQWIRKQIKSSQSESQVRLRDAESILSYLKNGIGKSLLPTLIGDAEPSIHKVSSHIVLKREVWMLVHPDLKQLVHIRKAMDWLVLLFENYKQLERD